MGVIGNIIANVTGKGAADIVTSVGNVADKFITTGQEKEEFKAEVQKEINRHIEAAAANATKNVEMHLADTANARDMNSKLQESDKASWLSKNVGYILDLFLAVIWGTLTVFIIMKALMLIETKADMTAVLSIYGTVTAVFMLSMNFHRGTSVGSERKQKQIEKMTSK